MSCFFTTLQKDSRHKRLTSHPPELHVLFRRDPVRLHHYRRPKCLVLRLLPRLLLSHVFFRPHPALQQRLPSRLQQRKPAGAPSLRRPPRLRRLLQRLVSQKLPSSTWQRTVGRAAVQQQQQLLLRQRRHQQILPDGQLHLLPTPRHHPALGQPAHLQHLPRKHNGPLRRRRLQQNPTPQPRLRPIRNARQRDVRAELCQREHSVRALLFVWQREEILRDVVEGCGGVVVERAACGSGDDGGGGGFVRGRFLYLYMNLVHAYPRKRCIYDSLSDIHIRVSLCDYTRGRLFVLSVGAGKGIYFSFLTFSHFGWMAVIANQKYFPTGEGRGGKFGYSRMKALILCIYICILVIR